MPQGLLSVIITIHNLMGYLPQCVESVLKQTYDNSEVILVDDGSTDGSGALCDKYAAADPRMRVIHQPALGAAAARAAGMRAAKGGFIHFVDGDDWLEPMMEERMMLAQSRADADVVIAGHILEADGRTYDGLCGRGNLAPGVYDRARMEREIFPIMMSIDGSDSRGVHPNLWMKLFRAETVRDAILRVDPRIRRANDVAACYEALYAANRIVIIDERYYHYRFNRPQSISASRIDTYWQSMEALLDHLLSSPMMANPTLAGQIPALMRSCVTFSAGEGSVKDGDAEEMLARDRLLEWFGRQNAAPTITGIHPSVRS